MIEHGAFSKFRMLATAACLMTLVGCNSTGRSVDSTLNPNAVAPGTDQAASADEATDLRAYCPKTIMRAGTETYDAFPPKMKKDDPEKARKLRFRATITDVVRECDYSGPVLNMKVGIAGRIISGPSGETGQFTLPVRVAVTQGDTVLYSKLHDLPANIPAGRANNNFSFVDDAVSIAKPTQQNIIVYVGFDELRVDLPNAVRPKDSLKPIN